MSAIFTPITATTFSISELRNIQEPAKSFSKRLSFSGEFSSRKSVSWDIRRRNLSRMKGFKWVRASTTDDGVPAAFEQEAFVDESLALEEGGIEASINNLSKWLISAIFAAFLVWRHDGGAVWAALGSALNVLLSVTLKNLLNQERPVSGLRSDPGMPSSHAQSIVYTVSFLIISLVERFGGNALTITLSGIFVLLGSYFAWLRVSQRLHTVSQVVVGAVVGSIFSFLWFWSWNTIVLNLFISYFWVRILIIGVAVAFVVGTVLNHYQGWLADL
ncbi:Phosphatidic acid phosphatase family protein [Perilla frutescens var. hirtella]|nr:Phosphatidic acid phosphatase family protein [Perilla frutescens var. hirtella]KAH6810182.1 Phosphatidic acid phosphatase family protein [Perilla frutescens var. frutescens]